MAIGDIYDSSASMDYVSTITDRLDRELVYWFTPEKIVNESWWIAQALSVIEVALLFDARNIGSTIYLDQPKAVQRWRDAFLGVWDADWQEDQEIPYHTYAYSKPDYRQQHRAGIENMFDRLESIATFWQSISLSGRGSTPEFTPLHPDYPLPYFSIRRWINPNIHTEQVHVERFISNLIEFLVKDIIYYLSPEKRAEVIGFNVWEVWVAVDVLAFLCETYEKSAGVNEEVVRNWWGETITIWKQFTKDDNREWDETNSLYQEVMGVFDHLEAVSRKYPPIEW